VSLQKSGMRIYTRLAGADDIVCQATRTNTLYITYVLVSPFLPMTPRLYFAETRNLLTNLAAHQTRSTKCRRRLDAN
jgi:hypothetical protein